MFAVMKAGTLAMPKGVEQSRADRPGEDPMRTRLTTSVMPKGVEPRNSWRIGLVFVLATLGGGIAANAQSVASPNAQGVASPSDRTASPAQRSRVSPSTSSSARRFAPPQRGISYNRVTTRPQAAGGATPRRTSAGSGTISQADSLRPFSAQAANPRVPASSSWSQQPQRPASPSPMMVRTTPHNYYPGMRPEQHPNANTAQITSGRRICIPSRGPFLASPARR